MASQFRANATAERSMGTEQRSSPAVGSIADGRRRLGMSALALWIDYFGLGGNGSLAEVEAWSSGSTEPPDRDHDFLAQALNDVFVEQGLDHPVGYRRA